MKGLVDKWGQCTINQQANVHICDPAFVQTLAFICDIWMGQGGLQEIRKSQSSKDFFCKTKKITHQITKP